MTEPMLSQSQGQGQSRQKMNYACEACRVAKTRCQPGPLPGNICKRCSEFKRECVFRTGPRTRRPKAAMRAGSATSSPLPPPPGPSKTFSIDFEMPATEDPNEDFETLRRQHEGYLDELVPQGNGADANDDDDNLLLQQQIALTMLAANHQEVANPNPTVVGEASEGEASRRSFFSFNDMSTSAQSGAGAKTKIKPTSPNPSSSNGALPPGSRQPQQQQKPASMNLGIKPQFNLDSAGKLLTTFRTSMLPHMPCVVLPLPLPPTSTGNSTMEAADDVRSLARTSPFVLLAILAATSCSSSLQGHSLYDEEFRKVLGLKFVAGGERSLELLQGILIYCAWYPFHLRPKNKQSFQYMRMAVDIVQDLEMEQSLSSTPSLSASPSHRARELDNLRALLGCYYAMSTLSITWGTFRSTLPYTPQLSRCTEILEQQYSGNGNGNNHNHEPGVGVEQDHHLVWLVRFQYVAEELIEAQRSFDRGPRDHQSEMQRNLIRAGLEARFHECKAKIPKKYASITSIYLLTNVTEACLLVPSLLLMPRQFNNKRLTEPASNPRLLQAACKIRAVFDHIASLAPWDFGGLCGADYGRFIGTVIMAYRLSFPMLHICRDYDVAQARRLLDLGEMLRRLIDEEEDGEEEEGGEEGKGKGKDNEDASGNGGGGAQKVKVSGLKSKGRGPATMGKRTRKSDAVSALRIVLRSVKVKFEEKSAALEAMSSAAAGEEWANTRNTQSVCPMLNGSLDQYLPLWAGQPQQSANGSYAMSQTSSTSAGLTTDVLSSALEGGTDPGTPFIGSMGQMGFGSVGQFEDKALMYHDLWATMTTGWAGDMGEVNMDDIGSMGYGGDILDEF